MPRNRAPARKAKEAPARPAVQRTLSSLWPFILVATVTAIVYANSLPNEFLFDDLTIIVEEQSASGSGPFAQLQKLFTTGKAYRPVRTASYAFDYAISGLDPWGYHVSNIAYHSIASIVVFLIARHLFNGQWIPLLTALLFAVHPVQTDAVTYLSGRRDVLSGLFVLTGFYLFLLYRRTARPWYLVMALSLYPLAFFSKESGIVLPLLCVAYDLVAGLKLTAPILSRAWLTELGTGVTGIIRKFQWLYLSLFVGAGGLAAYVLFVVRGTWQREYHGGSLWFTLLTDTRIFVHYLKLLIFPVTLNADYSYNAFPVTTTWTDPRAIGAGLVLLLIWAGLLAVWRTQPLATFGGLWFFLALLPVAQIIPHHEMMAEHYLYTPSVGVFLGVGALVNFLMKRQGIGRLLPLVCSVVVIVLGLRTVWRNWDWRDDLTLWTKTVEAAPQAARARNNLGAAYLRRGKLALAREQLETAIRIKSHLPYAHGNLGKVYFDLGDLTLAEKELLTALNLKPDEAIPRLWLGGVYAQSGRLLEAEQVFREVLHRSPRNAYAHNNLGTLLAKSGRFEQAEEAFRSALRFRPELSQAHENLSRLHRLQGRPAAPERAMGALLEGQGR